MPFRVLTLDRYILGRILGTMGSVLAVVTSLMILEHLPRLLEITRLSGHRGYIVVHTVAALLPEYGGIGLPVGLFLGIALTIRNLALGGELDVIEACGIAPFRWMRFPLGLAAMVSVLTILNQGWLVPAGETKLAAIAQRMEAGEFGHRLEAGQFIDLGSGSVLLFEQVDAVTGDLVGLFLRAEENIITARRGRFWQLPSGGTAIELRDGQIVQERHARVVDFARFEYRVGDEDGAPDKEPEDEFLKRVDIGMLWEDGATSSRSAVYGRCLWAALVLPLPLLALILGKPPRRQSGAAGILIGVVLLVLGLKMITPLIDGHSSQPELQATGILVAWGLFVSVLVRAERVFGQGYVDLLVSRIFRRFRRWTA
ncbi:lipopolysaccharide export system permease protein [Sphingobium xenophagum]|uniref:Lipopolysaccharide export system permease protein n=1 Tax=Sphingobium xenophagum TaxID=121428 RepID=A0ABU1X6E4_SPHXE|nr:LptF/LptG family permease [Sphingobium xenophagum]MDR7156706.1 lipopolysaccharide export system permease protein [Sphingobium xenophagum]